MKLFSESPREKPFVPASSYDSEGRLTNVTFPTGVVTSLHNDMSSGAVAVDIETSGRDEDISITTNLSSVDAFYTLVQGTLPESVSGCLPSAWGGAQVWNLH